MLSLASGRRSYWYGSPVRTNPSLYQSKVVLVRGLQLNVVPVRGPSPCRLNNNTVRLWSVSNSTHLQTLKSHIGSVRSVTFLRNRKIIASGLNDSTMRLWNAATGEHLRTREGYTSVFSL
ncbi:hypothetical protein F4825DRAFT_430994 [Nemania diffusa]|nr:hypothetical protein F4825DRAFT_430994 [Nemania diffusa]